MGRKQTYAQWTNSRPRLTMLLIIVFAAGYRRSPCRDRVVANATKPPDGCWPIHRSWPNEKSTGEGTGEVVG